MHRNFFSFGIILLIIGIGFILIPFINRRITVVRKSPFTLCPGRMLISGLYLRAGDIVEGLFRVRGGEDDIIFWIEDPKGDIIHKPADKVYRFAKFSFTATMDGRYWLYFDNRFSLSPKTIHTLVKIDTFGRFIWAMYPGGYLTILGAIVAIIGAAIEPKALSKPLPLVPSY